jgi:hypothetical protein
MATETLPTNLADAVRVARAVPDVPGAWVVPEDLVELAVRVVLVVLDDPVELAARVALVVPEGPVAVVAQVVLGGPAGLAE